VADGGGIAVDGDAGMPTVDAEGGIAVIAGGGVVDGVAGMVSAVVFSRRQAPNAHDATSRSISVEEGRIGTASRYGSWRHDPRAAVKPW